MKLDERVVAAGAVSPVGAPPATGRARGPYDLAVFLLVVVAPLVMTPFTTAPSLDAKMLILVPAALAMILRRETVQSTLTVPVALWLAAATVAALAGVNRWQSLLGREDQATGLLFLVVCGVCLLAGSRIPQQLRERLPSWLVCSGVAAACIGMAARVWPAWFQAATGRPLGAHGGGLPPLGHAVFLGAFLAAGIAAAVAVSKHRPALAAGAVAIMSAGLVLTGKRGPVAFAVVALVVAIVRVRPSRVRTALLLVSFVGVVGGLTLIDVSTTSKAAPLSAARRYDEVLSGSAAQRPAVWAAAGRAWTRRPLTGWGPAHTASATLSAATEAEARTMERIWQSAHNLGVESLVTTGILGVGGLAAVLLMALGRLRRGSRHAGWALGAAAALALHHAIQPMNLVVTPLFFLLLGVAGADREDRSEPRARPWFRQTAALVLLAAIPLCLMRFGASAAEANGRRYFSSDYGALRLALRLEPGRVSAASYLAVQRAIDGKGSERGAGVARAAAERLVATHPWDPTVRLVAADVEIMLGDPSAAARWLDRHLVLFPNDALGLAFRGFASVRMGDPDGARPYLERAERINPSGAAGWQPGNSAG